MENAVDALYIAGAILLLLVALTVGISSFSTQISQIDQIVENDERIDLATDESGELINYIMYTSEVREVGVETIVNTLYRSFKENYTVYIKLKDYSGLINTDKEQNKNIKQTAQKDQKYKGTNIIDKGNTILVFKITTEYNLLNAKERMNSILANAEKKEKDGKVLYDNRENGMNLYNVIKERNFTEYIGELYQNDICSKDARDNESEEHKKISDANKTRTRIITYIEK